MPTITRRRAVRCLCCLALAALTLPTTGCIAAAVTGAVVGAGAAGYAYYQGGAQRDYPATMDQTWDAAQKAVTDLGMPIEKAERDHDGGHIDARTGDGQKIRIGLEPRAARVPADGQWTHVTVRVAVFGDAELNERLLNQIDTHLPHPQGPVVPVGQQPNGRIEPVAQTGVDPTGKIQPVAQTGPPPLSPR